jgi:phage terminase small subunit
MDETDTLTPKQERFCREFLVDMNGTKASVRAGYGERSAHVTASRLLKKANVAARISELQAETAKRLEVTVDSVMADLEGLCASAVAAKQFGPAVRAKELQGKRLGMFIDRHDISESSNHADESLAARIAKEYSNGDTALARTLYRNILARIPPESFEPRPELSDEEIDALLSGGTIH